MMLRMIGTDAAVLRVPKSLVTGKSYHLGRSSTCSLVINDLSVSRVHAELLINDASILVKDLSSLNGTFIEGVRIHQQELLPGQDILFGTAKFRLVHTEDADLSLEAISSISTCAVTPRAPTLKLLSGAQQRVLDLLLKGHSEKEVAVVLGNSAHTVHNHVKEIYRRFGVNSRSALLALFVSDANALDKPAS